MLRKKIKIAAILSAAVLLMATAVLSVYAYFTTVAFVYTADGNKQVAHLGMNLSLLFDKLTNTPEGTQLPFQTTDSTEDDPEYYTYNPGAVWGTAQNPYVISDIRHLQNLSALQDIGYFYDLIIVDNFDADGDYTPGSNNKPYFLVCTPDGTPTTIDGTGIEIKPIGNEYYPFIGEIAGAPVAGTTTVPVKDGLSSDTSTIYNITIKSKRERPDHGIFGYVSYLGDTPDDYNTSAGTFNGYVSRIQGLLMADVSLVVHRDNLVEQLLGDLIDRVAYHVLSYTALSDSERNSVPHETHHIGILAGHVDYVDVTDISVYYSSDDIVCIDLNDNQAGVNYFSSTGIIGYVYSMNPQYDGNTIYIGTGSSSAGLGSLGGGGSASGVNPGYVLAGEMYKLYSQYSKPPILTENQLPTYESKGNSIGIKIEVSWEPDEDGEGGELFYTDELGRKLTPSAGNDPNRTWSYQQKNSDGTVSTITLDSDIPYFFAQVEITGLDRDGNYVYEPVHYISITGTAPDDYGHTKAVGTPFEDVYQVTVDATNNNMYLYSAKTDEDGTLLCSQWYRDLPILSWLGENKIATGRYYFYDGVFTFALSNKRDVIREIWPVYIPSILLADQWDEGTLPNDYTFKLQLKPVTSVTSSGRYILVYQKTQDAEGNALATPVTYVMNLLEDDSGVTASTFAQVVGSCEWTGDLTNGFEIDVTKDRVDIMEEYVFKYSSNSITSASDTGRSLGIKADIGYDGNIDLKLQPNYFLIAGDKNQPDETSSDTRRVAYSHYLTMTRDNGSGRWRVVFTNVEYYTLRLAWPPFRKNTNGTQYLTFNRTANSFDRVGDNPGYEFQVFEVTTPELVLLPPEENPQLGLVPSEDANHVNDILGANKYVLWPQTVAAGNATTTNTQYTLMPLSGLGYQETEDGKGQSTWRYKTGEYLYQLTDGLKYVFDLVEGAKFGSVTSNVLGGDYDGGQGFVKATLGTDGAETFIPMGCISFKVNKDPVEGDPIKIRVIVAVPTSTSPNGLSYNEDYYFGIWKNDVVAGQNQQFNFEKNGALQKFELPRSQPLYNKQGTRVDNNAGSAISVQYDANGNGTIDTSESKVYTTYFQGETVLVAYEFTVTEKGVYTLGATNGPMQIVYFSADGVASLGRDGTGGAYLQGIDLVYDTYGYTQNGGVNKIVTVTTKIPDTQDADVENYNYYYESSCLLRFDNNVQHNNQFVSIWHEKIYVRRVINEASTKVQKTQLIFQVTEGTELSTIESNRYVKCEPFALKSDEVVTTYTVTTGGPPTAASSTP